MKSLTDVIKSFFSNEIDEEVKGIKANDYGILDNFFYAVKLSWKYNKKFIIAVIVASVSMALFELVGVVIPKIVLDMVEKEVDAKNMFITLAIIGGASVLLNYLYGKMDNVAEFGFDKIQYHLMGNYLEKVFFTDYKNMENPEFLDLTERARRATYYNRGFHGYCMRLKWALNSLLVAVISGVSIFFIHPLIVVALGILSYFIYRLFENTMQWNRTQFEDAMAENRRQSDYLADCTRNFGYAKDIRLFGMTHWIRHIWKDINTVFLQRCDKRHNKWTMCEVKISLLNLLQNAILYVVLIYMVLEKGLGISNFVMYIGMVSAFSQAMTELFSNLVWMHLNKYQMDNYRTFMDWKEELPILYKDEGTLKDIVLDRYEFVFEDVSFKYPGHDEFVIRNLNLKIKDGMKLAVVGINGAGKTTLTKLLMRLYEPTYGRILLNGIDVKKYDRKTYFKLFAPVFQNVEVFAFPIWQNISMSYRDDTDMARVMNAIRHSGLDEKIGLYENGIETQLLRIFDKNGIDFSGGERQRLAMAKSLYHNRSVIILDEPTAALDAIAEDRMYQEFNEMVEGKTSIFISHRLSSTRFCDQIAMFENGQVVELGTHDELMEKNGKYAYMYKVQAQYYKENQDDKEMLTEEGVVECV